MKAHLVEWMDRGEERWIGFLTWFLVGVFVVPILLAAVTEWITLDLFYTDLLSANWSSWSSAVVLAPYLLYQLFRALLTE